jgi:prephenate dehydratase
MRKMRELAAPLDFSRPTSTVGVGYPGRDGAHSAAACDRLFPGGAELVALPSFTAVAEATAEGVVEFGVLPIESSLSGPVAETHDLLYDSPLAITGEAVLPIKHCLVGPMQVPLEEIRVVRSHPVALDQCRRLLAAMPWATAIAAATTADAAAQVAERGDPADAAIASDRAAKLYGLTIIAGDVGDHPEAYTRFVSIATHVRLDAKGERYRTAFSFVTDHQPGALHGAIEPFARHRIDLVQLVSRPIPHSPWRYRFDAVLDGHPLDAVVRDALADLAARTRRLRVFGSYPPDGRL